jgi:thioredoxin-like negative regulator of GroEL
MAASFPCPLSFKYLSFVSFPVRQDVAAECGITAMPTFQVWQKGAKVEEFSGASKDKLEALAKKYA